MPERTGVRGVGLGTVLLAVLGGLVGCTSSGDDDAEDLSHAPYRDPARPVAERVEDLLGRMSLAEKVGQMTQAERADATTDSGLVARLGLGSLLSGGGSAPSDDTPAGWADMVDEFQRQALSTRLGIPILYGVDSVHGHGNLPGATVFPHAIGLGATRDPELVAEVAHVAAEETRATGPQWVFAPCLCVARDDRWGRTYESLSEDPAVVEDLETMIDGFQGPPGHLADPDRVLATAKHYAGDGATRYDPAGAGSNGYPIDQGVTVASRAELERIALRPYDVAVRDHRVGAVMTSFSRVDLTDDGVGDPVPMHANAELVAGRLKRDLGFGGIVISDWLGIHHLSDPEDAAGDGPGGAELTPARVRAGVTSGIDVFMEPGNAERFVELLVAEVEAGRVGRERVDDAVRRILTAKFTMGLFEHPLTDRTHLPEVGSAAHRAVARRAVSRSQVLLRNTGDVLPLPPSGSLYVAGTAADDLGRQAGGWTVDWQGRLGAAFPGTSVLAGIREVAPGARVTVSADASAPTAGHDVGVVVVGETPYAEGFGDVGGPLWRGDGTAPPRPAQTMRLSAADDTAIDRVCGAVPTCVVLVVSGRPLVIDPARLASIDALVASWLPGSEGGGVADVLFGVRPFTGTLPMTWPRTVDQEPINVGDPEYDPLFPFGAGLRS